MSIRKVGNEDFQHPVFPKQHAKRVRVEGVVQGRFPPLSQATFNALANETLIPLFHPTSLPEIPLDAIPEDTDDVVEDGAGRSKAHSIYANTEKKY